MRGGKWRRLAFTCRMQENRGIQEDDMDPELQMESVTASVRIKRKRNGMESRSYIDTAWSFDFSESHRMEKLPIVETFIPEIAICSKKLPFNINIRIIFPYMC